MTRLVARSLAQRPLDSDVASLFDGMLGEAKNQEQAIHQMLQRHADELPESVRFEFVALQLALENFTAMLACDTGDCPNIGWRVLTEGRFCVSCAEKWTRCHQCRYDLHKAQAVSDDEGNDYHPGCYGPDEDAAYDCWIGGAR